MKSDLRAVELEITHLVDIHISFEKEITVL